MNRQTTDALAALVNGATTTVELFGANGTPGQKDWSQDWLKQARELLAQLESEGAERGEAHGESDEERLIRVILQDLHGKNITMQRATHLAVRIRDEGFARRLSAPPVVSIVDRQSIRKLVEEKIPLKLLGVYYDEITDAIHDLQLPTPSPTGLSGNAGDLMECPADLRLAVLENFDFQWVIYDMGLMPEQIKTRAQVSALRAAWMMFSVMMKRQDGTLDRQDITDALKSSGGQNV